SEVARGNTSTGIRESREQQILDRPSHRRGKAASSQNAKTNGFNAADPVLPNEDRNEFNALLERYKSEVAPKTAHEEFLVGQMTGARWKLNRLERIETEMFAKLQDLAEAFTNK